MKKLFKTVSSALLLGLVIGSFQISGMSNIPIVSATENEFGDCINEIVSYDPSFSILKDSKSILPLYDLDGKNIISYLISGTADNTQPYIIVGSDKRTACEFSLTESPYLSYLTRWLHQKNLSRDDISYLIYGGVGQYAVKINQQVEPIPFLQDDTQVSYENSPKEFHIQERSAGKKVLSVPDLGWRKGCGPTAGADVMMYLGNRYPNLVGGKTGEQIIDELASLMGTTNWWTSAEGLVNGLEQYASNAGYSFLKVEYQASPSYQYMVNQVDNNWVGICQVNGTMWPWNDAKWNKTQSNHLVPITGYDSTNSHIIFAHSEWKPDYSAHLGFSYDMNKGMFEHQWTLKNK